MQNEPSLSVTTCSIEMHFSPDQVEQGLQLLLSSVGCIESKTGCKFCAVARDAIDATVIHYKEDWESEALFRRHARSAEFQRVLITVDMCRKEPSVVIGNFSGHSGLTYLQNLCNEQDAR